MNLSDHGHATAVACPACDHRRAPDADADDRQCPACGVARAKAAGQESAGFAGTGGADASARRTAPRDRSLWMLIAVNVGALVLAWANGWTLIDMMVVYWAQSVVIGLANVARILALREFSTEGFEVNGESVEPTRKTQLQTAGFFAVHFGIFHMVYLVFLTQEGRATLELALPLLVCVAAFAVNHVLSLREQIGNDRAGTPNIGTLMFTPYLRILPMHLMIVFGIFLMNGGIGVLVFGALKTAADAGMHLVEQGRFGRTIRTRIG